MKKLFVYFVSFVTKIYFSLKNIRVNLKSSTAFFFSIKSEKSNLLDFENSQLYKSKIICKGTNNIIISKNNLISNTQISITGSNNKLIINSEVKLRGSVIIIRGTDCEITIGSNTTFGGIRIVNVGTKNSISIGEDCLFADNIELWGSDTHPIFNNEGICINTEKSIKIGNNVWVGCRVIILKGVLIGNGSIVGMGSIVTKSIPPNVISAGCPNATVKENIKWQLNY